MKRYLYLNNSGLAITAIAALAFLTVQSGCQGKTAKHTAADSMISAVSGEKWDPISPDTAGFRKRYTCVEIITTEGKLEVALFDETPKHRDNFIKLVKSGFYTDLLFHRIIRDFMVQGGDPDSKNAPQGMDLGQGGPGYTLPAEFVDSFYHYRGALAAARRGDEQNPEKQSSGSQFYIISGAKHGTDQLQRIIKDRALISFLKDPDNLSYNLRMDTYKRRGDMAAINVLLQELSQEVQPLSDSLYNSLPARSRQMYATWGGYPALDKEYTIFGFLVSGYHVLDKMQAVQTGRADRPVNDIRIISARVLDKPGK